MLRCAHSVGARACVRATVCVDEAPQVRETVCVSERVRMKEAACVSNMVCVVTSVPKCVPSSMPCAKETPCLEEAPRVKEAACVSERVCVSEARCVRSLYEREMAVGMRERAAASPSASASFMSRCVSVVARGSVCVRVRQRRRQMDKGRVAAVAVLGTAPGLHGSEREVRVVLHTRPPRARLSE